MLLLFSWQMATMLLLFLFVLFLYYYYYDLQKRMQNFGLLCKLTHKNMNAAMLQFWLSSCYSQNKIEK
jgi:hypothetical protein